MVTTPFEDRGHIAPWTSLAEGDAFLDALEASSDRVTTRVVGQAEGGADMRLVVLAHPTNPAPRTVLYVAQQHGEELSGREAMLTRLRDWADDPAMLDYLAHTTILCIPTAHPDNITTRVNVNGINVNRDHLNLTQSETRAIQEVIRDHAPSMVIDLHEGRNIVADFATSPTLNPNVDPAIFALSGSLDTVVKDAIEGSGRTWELYQGGNITGPEYFQNAGALRNAVTLLLETRRVAGDETDAGARHAMQLTAVDAIMEWHATSRASIEDAVGAAQAWVSQRPAFGGQHTLVVGTSPTGSMIDPLPAGYTLTTAQLDAIEPHRRIFGIASREEDSDHRVPLFQPAGALIPYLVDPASPVREVEGVPYEMPGGPAPDVEYATLLFRHEGVMYEANLRAS